MPDTRNYYVLCDDNCRFPGMTAEQIIAAIAEATGNVPEDVDDAFITKIQESNKQGNLTFWKGTEAEFIALQATTTYVMIKIDADGKIYLMPSNSVLPDGAVLTAKLADSSVTTDKLANYSVTKFKLAAGAVNNNNLADGAVTSDKLGAGAVTYEKLVAGAVRADRILDGTISQYKLAAGAITREASAAITTTDWISITGGGYFKDVTVDWSGISATSTVIVTPAPAFIEKWAECKLRATELRANKIRFACETIPDEALTANVLIFKVASDTP